MAMSRIDHEDDIRTLLTKTIDLVAVDPNTGVTTVTPNGQTLVPPDEVVEAYSLLIDHIVTNAEIGGVVVDVATPVGAVITAGVPVALDGGAALKASMLLAVPTNPTATQSNDGTGLVT